MSDAVRMDLAELKTFCANVLTQTGMSFQHAQSTAATLVTTDAMGVVTHGTKLLAGYVRKLLAGGYLPKAQPRIEREVPA